MGSRLVGSDIILTIPGGGGLPSLTPRSSGFCEVVTPGSGLCGLRHDRRL